MNKKIKPPAGWPAGKPWTEKEAAEAIAAANSGLSRSDFSDDGADLQELKEIWNDLPSSFTTKIKINKVRL